MPHVNASTLGPAARRHVAIAQRVADAHAAVAEGVSSDAPAFAPSCAFVSGSTVDDLVDDLSDVDMSIVYADRLPGEAALRAACLRAAGAAQPHEGTWTWSIGHLDDTQPGAEGGVVAFRLEGVEVQIGYTTAAALDGDLDELLVRHNPDTPNHKLAEGIAKALPLIGPVPLQVLQQRLARFPDELARAMVVHGLDAQPTHWRAARQLPRRDAALWCREIQMEACYGLVRVLCGLNRQWFTRFQFKRMRKLEAKLPLRPDDLVDRMEAVLAAADPRQGFDLLHRLEDEVLVLVETHRPDVDVAAARKRHRAYLGL